MAEIPCEKNEELQNTINKFAEDLRVRAHEIGDHGLEEEEFYRSGVFRGAIERLRGQFSASMSEKRDFIRHVLNYMQDRDLIGDWESAEQKNRFDYEVELKSGRVAAIEAKGCLDGNNTNIFERPNNANEFYLWSVCTNPSSDPRRNAWSGIHTRLGAEIISKNIQIDGLIIWDMVCNTFSRKCPKVTEAPTRQTDVAQFRLPPPCVYVMPATVPSVRNNPAPKAQRLEDLEFLSALHRCFKGEDSEVHCIDFEVKHEGAETLRRTLVRRGGEIQRESTFTAIRRGG